MTRANFGEEFRENNNNNNHNYEEEEKEQEQEIVDEKINTSIFTNEELKSKLPSECFNNYSPIAVLWNVYDTQTASLDPEFFCDLEIDLREELSKFGQIISLFTPLHAQLNGVVIVFYDTLQSAYECVESLKNRIFDGRKVRKS